MSVAGTVRLARVTTTSLRPRGVDPDKRVVAHRIENGVHGYGAGLAEVRRAEDRHIGDDAGILDQIADAHDVAVNDRFGLQPWRDLELAATADVMRAPNAINARKE